MDTFFNFSVALELLHAKKHVCRMGWNPHGEYLLMVPASPIKVGDTEIEGHPYIGLKTRYEWVVPWVPSQTDMQSDDWLVVN